MIVLYKTESNCSTHLEPKVRVMGGVTLHTSCVTLDRSLNLSELWYLQLYIINNDITTCLRVAVRIKQDMCKMFYKL